MGLTKISGAQIVGVLISGAVATTAVAASPFISSISPLSGAPGTVVTISGRGLTGIKTAWVGAGHDGGITNVSDSSVKVTIPADGTSANIGISNGSGWSFSGQRFTVSTSGSSGTTTPPATTPVISSMSPSSGAVGTMVTVSGTGLSGVTAAWVGAGHDAVVTPMSATTVKIKVPADAATGKIALGNGSKMGYSTANFVVTSSSTGGSSSGSTTTGSTGSTSGGTSGTSTGSTGSGSTGTSTGSGSSSSGTGGTTGTNSNPGPGVSTTTTTNANGPSAPAGGVVFTGQTISSISLSWNASAAGSSAVKYYKIYRNGVAYATTTVTSYTDLAAVNATVPTYTGPATTYTYSVSAVDNNGYESARTTQATSWVYYNGVFNWAGDYDYGSATSNYADTGGTPEVGPYDIKVSVPSPYGGFLPYSGKVVPLWDLEGSAFNYLTIDMKPTVGGQNWRIMLLDRIVPGDISNNATVTTSSYGTASPGKWTTYKIPLAAVGIGKNTITASISGTTMTVTAVGSNVQLTAGGFITGNGVAAGTYIASNGSGNGGVGTYTLSSSQSVGSSTLQYQRTNIYKVNIQDLSGVAGNTYYIDNFGFTAQ